MTCLLRARIALAAIVLVVATPAVLGQAVLYTFHGDSALDGLGTSIAGAGDVNGDGFDDVIAGAPGDDNNGPDSGSARVFSGADGAILYMFNGSTADDLFGWSVDGAGDVNGDGFDDLIVGAPFAGFNGKDSGRALVFSGKDGSVLHAFDGVGFAWVGWSVAGAGDVDGDGFADVIVGAVVADRVTVFSGKSGSVIHVFSASSSGEAFGNSVDGAGDLNGDGFSDLIVGAPSNDTFGKQAGMVQAFSGKDGSILYTQYGSESQGFGSCVRGAGDVNGDNLDDVVVGAMGDKTNGFLSGAAKVLSGNTGSTLHAFFGDSPGDLFGSSVSGAGDFDGDGYDDLIVGALAEDNNGDKSGSARLFSGLDGSILVTIGGEGEGQALGRSVAGAGDADGNGCQDLIVATNGNSGAGSVMILAGCCPFGSSYCGPANLNSTGQSAVIQACGSEIAAALNFSLRAADMPTDELGYFLASQTQGFVPFAGGSQGNLCLGGTIGRFRQQIQNSGPGGTFAIAVDLMQMPMGPPVSVMAGETWNFQAWFRDQNPAPTSNFTDGVSILFQ